MRRYLARRLLQLIPTFFGITLLTFAIAHLAPGDPLQLDLESASAQAGANTANAVFRAQTGLDQPLPVQYLRWLGKLVRFDFGTSLEDHRPVADKLGEALPRTLLVAGLGLFLAYLFGVPLGVFTAIRPRSVPSRAVSTSLTALYATPSFFVAVMLLLLFSSGRVVEWFPFQGLRTDGSADWSGIERFGDLLWHLVLPVICLGYPTLAVVSRQVRSAMITALAQDHIRAARARGIPERSILFRHALKNSLLPVITMAGLSIPHVVGGSVVVERVFGINGMGLLAFDAIARRDYPVVMGVTTLSALVTLFAVLLADLAYGLADPRIRVQDHK